nr:hypothetical protein [Tanacetum cinerariifolium]
MWFDSKEDEVVPKVEDVSLVDGVFDGALGGDGYEDFAIEEGEKEYLHERYLHQYHHRHDERMMDDQRQKKRKRK